MSDARAAAAPDRVRAVAAVLRRSPWLIAVPVFFIGIVLIFAPAFLEGRYLATGDGVVTSIPLYYGPHALWTSELLLGSPEYANPSTLFWYPLSLLAFIPHSFNWFIIAGYLVAAIGTFGYVRALTQSTGSGIVSGFSFALGAFLISHLGHVMILQAAVWLPVAVWGVEELRSRPDLRWVAVLAVGIACMFLGGHPQVFVYGTGLTFVYAVFCVLRRTYAARRYALRIALGFALGLGLCAVTLIPSYQLLHFSIHQHLSFDEFASFALPLAHLPVYLFFPYFFGQAGSSLYPLHEGEEFGIDGGFVEVSQYAGLLAMLLAAIAIACRGRDLVVRFWCAVAAIALWLAVGPDLGASQVAYHLPIINLTPAPGRNAMEFTFAVAVLAGIGYSVLATGGASLRRTVLAVSAVVGAMAATYAGILFLHARIEAMALARMQITVPLDTSSNASIGEPFIIAILGAIALVVWARFPKARAARIAVFAILALDLHSFAGSAYWHRGVQVADLEPPPAARAMRTVLQDTRQRVLSVRGAGPFLQQLPPNVSMLWGLPSAGGYDSLEESRTAGFLNVYQTGRLISEDVFGRSLSSLDLAAVRFAVFPPIVMPSVSKDAPWAVQDITTILSRDKRLSTTEEQAFGIPQGTPATEVGLVTAMQIATRIRDGTVVAVVTVSDGRRSVRLPLVAGRHTSESAYDRPDLRAAGIAQRRAPLFSSLNGYNYYTAFLKLPAPMTVRALAVRWTGGTEGSLILRKLTLLDGRTKTGVPISSASLAFGNAAHWRMTESTATYTILQNLGAFPRAWVVDRVKTVAPEQALAAIRSGRFDDGEPFDPHHVALVEQPVALEPAGAGAQGGSVAIRSIGYTRMELVATCAATCFVVTSDAYYPGWQASVDDEAVPVYQADYALRGVVVPSGLHVVHFTYRPLLFYASLLVTLLSVLALAGVVRFGGALERRFVRDG